MTASWPAWDEGGSLRAAGAILPLDVVLDLVDAVNAVSDARRGLQTAQRVLAMDLALARAAYGVSVQQLAGQTGLSRRAVNRMLRRSAR